MLEQVPANQASQRHQRCRCHLWQRKLVCTTINRTSSSFISHILHLSHSVRERFMAWQSPDPSFPTISFSTAESNNDTPQASNQDRPLLDDDHHTHKFTIMPSWSAPEEIKHHASMCTQQKVHVCCFCRCTVHGVKRTFHAYAERPLCVHGRQTILFRNSMNCEGIQ
jgi:hypothetical protein